MAKQKLKTEHSGPKNGGGHWGTRKEGKRLSSKARRSQGRKESKSTEKLTGESVERPKVHPWRMCSEGRHWVRTHSMTVEPSEKHPDGKTIRHGHCADNPNRGKGKKAKTVRDYIETNEMNEIAKDQFGSLKGPPAPAPKEWPYKSSDLYDDLIRGWTKYWNDIFHPSYPLDPNLVKALIASESGFNPKPNDQSTKSSGKARGLIQLTDQTIRILGDVNGELKDHYVKMSRDDAYDPNLSVAAGTRWLFYKKEWASNKLGREASWDEAIAAYKGYLPGIISGKNPNPTGMQNIRKHYQELK